MKAIAVVNSSAGSVGPDGAERMRDVLGSHGLETAEVVEFDLDNGEAQLRRLAARSCDLFVVWGGDGTHRSALNTIGQTGSNLVLLPGGTMSLLSKWIHGDRSWSHTLRLILAASRTRRLSAGQVSDARFYCALLAGVPACFAEARESLRYGDLGRAMHDVGVAIETARHVHLEARLGKSATAGDGRLEGGNVIGALVGPLSRTGRMEVGALTLPSIMSALDFAWTSFRSGWRDFAGAATVPADTLSISSDEGGEIPAIMDGERVAVGDRFRVTFVEAAARCLEAS